MSLCLNQFSQETPLTPCRPPPSGSWSKGPRRGGGAKPQVFELPGLPVLSPGLVEAEIPPDPY